MRSCKTHPFDLENDQIDIDLILDKNQKPMHPDVAKLLASVNPDHYLETTLEVSYNPTSIAAVRVK